MTDWRKLNLIELKALGARELQAACKEAGIKSGVKIDDMAQRLFESLGHDLENAPDETQEPEKPEPEKTEKPTGAKQIDEPCTMPGCKDSFGKPGMMRGGRQAGSIQCSGKRRHTWFLDVKE